MIRPAGLDDVEEVLRLWREAGAVPTHTDDVASLAQLIAFDPSALLVACADDRIVGSVIAAWDGWRGTIYRLVVAPSHRRHGLARELVAAACDRLAAAGAVRLQASVNGSDAQAMGFWATSGWQPPEGSVRFTHG